MSRFSVYLLYNKNIKERRNQIMASKTCTDCRHSNFDSSNTIYCRLTERYVSWNHICPDFED